MDIPVNVTMTGPFHYSLGLLLEAVDAFLPRIRIAA